MNNPYDTASILNYRVSPNGSGLIPKTVMDNIPAIPKSITVPDPGIDEEDDDEEDSNTQTKLETVHDQTRPAGIIPENEYQLQDQGNMFLPGGDASKYMTGGASSMDLSTATPELPSSTGIPQDQPKGMLQRISDAVVGGVKGAGNFLSGQANQFAAEQTGTEDKETTTPMGRVLRAIAGVGALATVGGTPAVTAGAGVAGAIKDVISQQRAAKKAQEEEDAEEEDRQITNKLKQAQTQQILAGGKQKPVDPVMKALQIRKAQLENQKLQDSIENGNDPSLAISPATEPDKPVTPAVPSYNGKDELMPNKSNAEFDKTVVQPVLSSLRTNGVWGGLLNGHSVRSYFNTNKDGLDIISKLNPSQQRSLVESLVQIKQSGAITPAQKADQLQSSNPQAGTMDTLIPGTVDTASELYGAAFPPLGFPNQNPSPDVYKNLAKQMGRPSPNQTWRPQQ
jgi:hypothetical protein